MYYHQGSPNETCSFPLIHPTGNLTTQQVPLPTQSFQFPLLTMKELQMISTHLKYILCRKDADKKGEEQRKQKGRKESRKGWEELGSRRTWTQCRGMGTGLLNSLLCQQRPKGKYGIHKTGTGC